MHENVKIRSCESLCSSCTWRGIFWLAKKGFSFEIEVLKQAVILLHEIEVW